MRPARLAPAVVLLLFVFPAVPVGAQEPPAGGAGEALQEEPDRWQTVLDLAFTSASGNERITLVTSELRVTHLIDEDYQLELGTRARYGRSEGEEVARNYRLSLQFDLHPAARISPFLFGTAEHDPFRRLDLRANGGAGARYRFLSSERAELSLSLAVLYSHERQVDAEGPGVETQRDGRFSWRVKGHREVREGVRLEHVTFYQPIWDRTDDYLLEVQNVARALVASRVAVAISHTFQRDSTPLPEVRKNDQLLQVGLTFEL